MPLVVHHLRHAQSERIIWLCEELGIEYTLRSYDRIPLAAPPALKELAGNLLGDAPMIEDGEGGQQITLCESDAIVEYILALHGQGSSLVVDPTDTNYAQYLYWKHAANGSLQPALIACMSLEMADVPSDAFMRKYFEQRLANILTVMDQRLASTGTYLAGDKFSVADIMIPFSLTTFRRFYRYSLAKYPNVLTYLQRIGERPAYQTTQQKGNPSVEPLLGAEPPAKTIFEIVQEG